MRAPARLVLCALALGTAACLAAPASASTCRVGASADVTSSVHADAWYDAGIHDAGQVGDANVVVNPLGSPALTAHDPMTQSEGQGIVEALTGVWVPGLVCS